MLSEGESQPGRPTQFTDLWMKQMMTITVTANTLLLVCIGLTPTKKRFEGEQCN